MPGMLGTLICPWLQVALGSRHNQKGEIYKPGYGSLVSHEGTAWYFFQARKFKSKMFPTHISIIAKIPTYDNFWPSSGDFSKDMQMGPEMKKKKNFCAKLFFVGS